jgi:hypothetical protein
MFMARLHRRALAFLGFWVGKLLAGRRESYGAALACIIESRRTKGGLMRIEQEPT